MIDAILLARDQLRWRNQPPDQCGFYLARVSRRDAIELRRELKERRAPRGKLAARVAVMPGWKLVAIVQDVAVLTRRSRLEGST